MAGAKLENDNNKQASRKRKYAAISEPEAQEDRQTRRIRKGRAVSNWKKIAGHLILYVGASSLTGRLSATDVTRLINHAGLSI
jgi:hypothetical protein